jgi:uncharacterized protein (TIGR02996 family)
VVNDHVRFEKGPSFVELWREPRTLVRAFGQVGTEGTSRSEAHPDEPNVKLAYERQVKKLESKGYRAGAHNPQLADALKVDPADPAPYLVYADWLLDHEDVRGELIMRMWKRASFDDLLTEHAAQLEPPWWKDHGISTKWRLGFVQQVAVERCTDEWVLRRLLRHPSLEVLEELRVVETPSWRGNDEYCNFTWTRALEELPSTVKRVRVPKAFETLRKQVPKPVLV